MSIYFSLAPVPSGSPDEASLLLLDDLKERQHQRVAPPHLAVEDVLALVDDAVHAGVHPPQSLHHLVVALYGRLAEGAQRDPHHVLGPLQVLVAVHVQRVKGGRHGLVGAEVLDVQPAAENVIQDN